MSDNTFYITTPIYYPSDHLHIGHAYTTVYCDAIARWHRLAGKDVYFLTGSDEHGLKVARAAAARGKAPQAHVDEIAEAFQRLWRRLGVSYDDFIRTTEARHERVVQHIFKKLYDQGDIYLDTYQGWYCTPCETFWPESRLDGDRLCPDCGRPVELVEEDSYFFKISKYAPRLLEHIEQHPEFIQPETRRNEMVSFIKQGLEELCVSRTTFDWGVRVPFDSKHVVYVWIDALTNYITGIGYLQDDASFNKWWPADLHVVGKDILRFHTIIWPCILMAAELELPKQVYGHGWLVVDTGKMSKSKGNVVDPHRLVDEFGVDAIRHYLLREVGYGQDATYARRAMVERINADLANDLGNALHRVLAMLGRYRDGVVPEPGEAGPREQEIQQLAGHTVEAVGRRVTSLEVNLALSELWRLVDRLNKYIDESEPWALAARDEAQRLDTVLYHVLEALRIVGLLVGPFLPETGQKIWEQLGIDADFTAQRLEASAWGGLRPGTKTKPGKPLFPRIDVEEAMAVEAAELEPENGAAAAADGVDDGEEGAALIDIDTFAKLDLRLAQVIEAEKVKGADKLLKLQLEVGGTRRQVVAGIAQHFAPSELTGKRVVIVANLKPVTLRGERSEGMILAAEDDEGRLALLTADGDVASGAKVR